MLQAEGAPKRRRLAETRGWGGTWKGRATTRPHVRSPSFDLSEKLRKQAEKDKGKQGPRRTLCPLPQVAESGGGEGEFAGSGRQALQTPGLLGAGQKRSVVEVCFAPSPAAEPPPPTLAAGPGSPERTGAVCAL